jgi:hypothetical protein
MSSVTKMFSPKPIKPTVTRITDRSDPALEEERRRKMRQESMGSGRESTRLTEKNAAYSGGVLGE